VYNVPIVKSTKTTKKHKFHGPSGLPPIRTVQVSSTIKSASLSRALASYYLNDSEVLVLATDATSWNAAELVFKIVRLDGKGGERKVGKYLSGSTADGGLGSIVASSVKVSPDGGKVAWTDTDGRLQFMNLLDGKVEKIETWITTIFELTWDPGSRYLAFSHSAKNQFTQISIFDSEVSTSEGAPVQVTSDRCNNDSPVFGAYAFGGSIVWGLYFTTDRDVISAVDSPWGTRAPSPFFPELKQLYVLPLSEPDLSYQIIPELISGEDSGRKLYNETKNNTLVIRNLEEGGGGGGAQWVGATSFALSGLPSANYNLVGQTQDGICILLVEVNKKVLIGFCGLEDRAEILIHQNVAKCAMSNGLVYCLSLKDAELGVAMGVEIWVMDASSVEKMVDSVHNHEVVDVDMVGSVVVNSELQFLSMYGEGWRMLRDYFYDKEMHGVDWPAMYAKFLPLAVRVGNREELDDVFKMMSGELSALHVFVYGGEYRSVTEDEVLIRANAVASLGVDVLKVVGGFEVVEVWEGDADFDKIDNSYVYSPLSDKTLKGSSQRGVGVGDVIGSVDGLEVSGAERSERASLVKNEFEFFSSFHIVVCTACFGPSLHNHLYKKMRLAEPATVSNFERLKPPCV